MLGVHTIGLDRLQRSKAKNEADIPSFASMSVRWATRARVLNTRNTGQHSAALRDEFRDSIVVSPLVFEFHEDKAIKHALNVTNAM